MVAKGMKATLAITGLGSIATLVIASILIVNGSCEETAEAGESVEQRRDRLRVESQSERERMLQAQEMRDREFEETLAARPKAPEVQPAPPPRVRKVRRWVWESPAETRSKLWNTPETKDIAATTTGLLRICMTEADGYENDCRGIWQVVNNIRSSKCNRGRIRRITECDENGETPISVMRRAQKFALGIVPPRSQRTRWIAALGLSCDQPGSFPGSKLQWISQYSRSCGKTVALVKGLVSGEDTRKVIPGRPIAWGGRCESGNGACDDPLACARGLIRIRGTDTKNAFWKRAGIDDEIDPICRELGFGREASGTEVVQAEVEMPEVGSI